MSELVPHLRNRGYGSRLAYREPLTSRDFKEGLQPVLVDLGNSTKGRGTCLGCGDAPCMVLSEGDMELPGVLREFPGNPSREVCPTRAIDWDDDDKFVRVDSGACIGCGLCVARCPYGAISLNEDGVALVESNDPDGMTVPAADALGQTEHLSSPVVGRIGPMDIPVVGQMPAMIDGLYSNVAVRFIRNLLIQCGVQCRIRRTGDTNIRMDGVLATPDGTLGVLEVEFGNGALESPRALLEDLAVLRGRYGIQLDNNTPVSVVAELPSTRSEYFRVINDIEEVLSLRCRTVTVGALLALFWNFQKIEGFSGDLFTTSPEDTDLLPALQRHFTEAFPADEPYPGAYRPPR